MNSLGHFLISISKSILRIFSCIYTLYTGNVIIMAIGFLISEILGIIEELVDKR